jgi:ankyrin repeat protein
MSFVSQSSHCKFNTCPCKKSTFRSNIWTASEQGNLNLLIEKTLLDKTLVNKLDNYGYSPLHYAAQQNHLQIVKYLLNSGAIPDNQSCGATALHRAVYNGNYEAVNLLIKAGANVNISDTSFGDNNTPLHKALLRGYSDIASMLITNGADVHIKNSCGLSSQDLMNLSSVKTELSYSTNSTANISNNDTTAEQSKIKNIHNAESSNISNTTIKKVGLNCAHCNVEKFSFTKVYLKNDEYLFVCSNCKNIFYPHLKI